MSLLNTVFAKERIPHGLEVEKPVTLPSLDNGPARMLLNESAFVSMLYLERRRAERAQKRFVLMLVDVTRALQDAQKNRTLTKISVALTNCIRETDILGWYLENSLIGVIGTELGSASPKAVQQRLLEKARAAFGESLGKEKGSTISVSFHFFPDEDKDGEADHSANIALYPDISRHEESKKIQLGVKRAMDVAGSAAALLLFSPVYAAVAVAIKLT
jgi:GGDEF domain-containing protein